MSKTRITIPATRKEAEARLRELDRIEATLRTKEAQIKRDLAAMSEGEDRR